MILIKTDLSDFVAKMHLSTYEQYALFSRTARVFRQLTNQYRVTFNKQFVRSG